MGSYAAEHASALADVLAAGAAVTFTSSAVGSYDETTDEQMAPAVTTVTGGAIAEKGSLNKYMALGLSHMSARTLFFVPTTYGQRPSPSSNVTWNGFQYSVKLVEVIDPDGVAIAARVVIDR